MTTWRYISSMPTCVDELPQGCKGVHESTLRSYQLLQKVKDYLQRGVPADVILELIAEVEGKGTERCELLALTPTPRR